MKFALEIKRRGGRRGVNVRQGIAREHQGDGFSGARNG